MKNGSFVDFQCFLPVIMTNLNFLSGKGQRIFGCRRMSFIRWEWRKRLVLISSMYRNRRRMWESGFWVLRVRIYFGQGRMSLTWIECKVTDCYYSVLHLTIYFWVKSAYLLCTRFTSLGEMTRRGWSRFWLFCKSLTGLSYNHCFFTPRETLCPQKRYLQCLCPLRTFFHLHKRKRN